MLAITHLIVSLLLIYVLTLDKNESFVALMFGVFIDVDHLLGLRGYVEVNGFGSLVDFDSLMTADGQWKSLLHNPVAVMVVGPVATASRLALPLLFWGVHVSMDYAEDTVLGLFSPLEMALLAGSAVMMVVVGFKKHRLFDPSCPFSSYLRHLAQRLASPVERLRVSLIRLCGL